MININMLLFVKNINKKNMGLNVIIGIKKCPSRESGAWPVEMHSQVEEGRWVVNNVVSNDVAWKERRRQEDASLATTWAGAGFNFALIYCYCCPLPLINSTSDWPRTRTSTPWLFVYYMYVDLISAQNCSTIILYKFARRKYII